MGSSLCPVLTVCGWGTPSPAPHTVQQPQQQKREHQYHHGRLQEKGINCLILPRRPAWITNTISRTFLKWVEVTLHPSRVRKRNVPQHPKPSLSMPGCWSLPPTLPPCLGCLHCWWQSLDFPKWDPAKHISTAWPPVRAHSSACMVPKSNSPAKQFLTSQKFQSNLIKICKKKVPWKSLVQDQF